jgi:hypothetical protein
MSAHFHVATKPNWWTIGDGLPQYVTGYTNSGLAK